MLINMQAKLSRPDLQISFNQMCKIYVQHEMISQVEHVPGKQTVIPDAVSRNKPIPNTLVHNFTIKIHATNSI